MKEILMGNHEIITKLYIEKKIMIYIYIYIYTYMCVEIIKARPSLALLLWIGLHILIARYFTLFKHPCFN